MPIHNGIKLTIVSQLEFQVHPEFAHPESSQFTNRSPDLRRTPSLEPVELSPPISSPSESKADRLLGRPASISVYIPSVPGVRFWLRYSIDDEAAQISPWYYFKLFMNGRHITSWGTNSKTAPSGQIMRGLFEPSDKWNYKYEGTVFKNMGTETRPFFFAKEDQERSAATDGGLIEVLVYRAKGRKRKMPEPADWKAQEQYGIVMPSSGLFENPQDAKYYDWDLRDPKDVPYGSFRFHYRSWDNLESLQLIPTGYPRKLLAPSASILSLNGLSRELQAQLEESESEEEEALEIQEVQEVGSPAKSSIESQVSDTQWLTNVFDDDPEEELKNLDERQTFVIPPEMAPLYPVRNQSVSNDRFSLAIVDKPTSAEDDSWKLYLDRPLPEIPLRRSSLRRSRGHSRKSSSNSNTPSITPSLLTYLERDTLSPEPEFGLASVVAVSSHASPVLEEQKVNAREYSPSRYSSSPGTAEERASSVIPLKKLGVTPPPLFLSFPNITLRKTRNSPPKTPRKRSKQKTSIAYSPYRSDEQSTFVDSATTFSLSESEWMCRTPSPLKEHYTLRENQSPIALKEVSDSEVGSLLGNSESNRNNKGNTGQGSLRKKAFGWYEKVKGGEVAEADNHRPVHGFEGGERKVRMGDFGGSWI